MTIFKVFLVIIHERKKNTKKMQNMQHKLKCISQLDFESILVKWSILENIRRNNRKFIREP